MFLNNYFVNVLVFALLLNPKNVPVALSGYRFLFYYQNFYDGQQKKVILYHKKRLRELDKEFIFYERSMKLIKMRRQATDTGVDPLSPEYPDIFDVHK